MLFRAMMALVGLIGTAIVLIFAAGEFYETSQLRSRYGHEAIKALALDAVREFHVLKRWKLPTVWSPSETPCIFTTNTVLQSGNRPSVELESWPEGSVPACQDFFLFEKRDYDPRTTIPSYCSPAIVFPNRGGPDHSFVVAVTNGAIMHDLAAGTVSKEGRRRLASRNNKPSGFYYTGNFVRGGGLAGVSIELLEQMICDGFTLFRYQTEVTRPRAMHRVLETAGYSVGLK